MDHTSRLLRTQITSQNLPCPSPSFLASLISTRSPTPPLASLAATAKARLLACDLTTSDLIDSSQLSSFPAEILDAAPRVQELSLQRDVCVQVLDIENLASSRWEQIEELEAIERGERTRGRQVIRVTGDGDGSGENEEGLAAGRFDAPSAASGPPSTAAAAGPGRNATHRLVVQDHRGQRIYAVELKRMPDMGVATTSIGCKLLLRAGSVVARGIVLLTPETCLLLGGRIDPWHDAWVVSRMARLKEAVGRGPDGATSTSR
ncbi:hypothetical protein E4U21_000097 [Claviceps maximensis]|nr:hypothetical protein E4U21_000097 [Claviceps maximensis]